jgi:hypothetical protein
MAKASSVSLHLLSAGARDRAFFHGEGLLYSLDDVTINLVQQTASLVLDGVERITVAGDFGLYPVPKSFGFKASYCGGVICATKEPAVDRNTAPLHGVALQVWLSVGLKDTTRRRLMQTAVG